MPTKSEGSLQHKHPKQNRFFVNCPLFLLNAETVSLLDQLLTNLQSGGYSPLSLRELFRCRRGVSVLPDRVCGLILRGISEDVLRKLLPLLNQYRYPIMLFEQEFYSAKMYSELRQYPFLFLFAEASLLEENETYLFPPDFDLQTAVISERLDTAYLEELRKQGVRMVLTEQEIRREGIPSGLDVLPLFAVTKEWDFSSLPESNFSQEDSSSVLYLPAAIKPMFSNLELAVPLCILGADAKRLPLVLACASWNTVYSVSEDRYTITAELRGLKKQPIELSGNPESVFRTCLQEGWYIHLKTKTFRVPCQAVKGGWFTPESLLVYGYDDTCGTFSAMTVLSPGNCERVDLMKETLARLCKTGSVILLASGDDDFVFDSKKLREQLQIGESFVSPEKRETFYGWEAAVRYVNRFHNRLASEKEVFSADSVRAFLEERLLYGLLLQFCAEREDLCIEPLDAYCAMLEKEAKPALQNLCGREVLHLDVSLFLLCDLMRKLLIAEEACRTAFEEESVRAMYRTAYLRGKGDFQEENV